MAFRLSKSLQGHSRLASGQVPNMVGTKTLYGPARDCPTLGLSRMVFSFIGLSTGLIFKIMLVNNTMFKNYKK